MLSGSRSFINSFSLWHNSYDEWFRTRLHSPQKPSKHYLLIYTSSTKQPSTPLRSFLVDCSLIKLSTKAIQDQKLQNWLYAGLIGNWIRFQVILFQNWECLHSITCFLYCCIHKRRCVTLLIAVLNNLQFWITTSLLFLPNYFCRWKLVAPPTSVCIRHWHVLL
jgi:hypothetical protein